jgi:hypothetical protein
MPTPKEGPEPQLLDDLEMEMYHDLYRALPRFVGEALGIEARQIGSTLRLTARGIDHPFFNRVMGAGVDRDPVEELAEAARHFGEAGVRRWMLQLLPDREPDGFRAKCEGHRFVRLRGWAKHLGPVTIEPEA